MIKVLFYGESPVVSTGLAQVSRTILDALQSEGHQVEVVGTNHHLVQSYDGVEFPYDIVPVLDKDNPNVTQTVIERIKSSAYDVFFCSTDFGRDLEVFQALIAERKRGREFLIVGYYAVDCDVIPPSTFDPLAYCNVKIVYSKHGKEVIERLRPEFAGQVNVIYLACEPNVFYPLSSDERRQARKELFQIEDNNTFLCLSVNRNQSRKDLGRCMQIFHQFHLQHHNSMLYMHAQKVDAGGNLFAMSQALGMSSTLDNPEVIFSGENFNVLQGYTREAMNRIYNAADCLISTSTGEGWGLSTTEAMAAGCPVVVPNNTAFTEIVGEHEERGYLVKTGGNIDHSVFLYSLSCNPRDIVHADSMLEKMEQVYNHRDETKLKTILARHWTLQHTKEQIGEKWKALFGKIEQELPVKETVQ